MLRRWAGTVVCNFTEGEARGETRCSYSATTRIDWVLAPTLLGGVHLGMVAGSVQRTALFTR